MKGISNAVAQDLVACARPLIAAVKGLDATRPVTAALANMAMSDTVGVAERVDVVGCNYQESRYPTDHQKYPKRFIYGSENGAGWAQWLAVRDNDYVGGRFLWTGIDYLGEANRWSTAAAGLACSTYAASRSQAPGSGRASGATNPRCS